MPIERGRVEEAFDRTLAWSRAQGWLEHTKHDALNSPLVWALCGHHRVTRILATQAVMRFPVNLRPLLGVPRVHNPKGLALFVRALLDRHRATGRPQPLAEAGELLAILDGLRSPGEWGGACWGYQYPWQDLGFFAPRATPNAVVTAFVCEAFLDAWQLTGRREHLDTVVSAAGFFMRDLKVLHETADELCLGYMPLPMTMRVMDVSILVGAVLARLHRATGERVWRETAVRLTRFVVNRQTDEGAWYYTDPPEDSPVKIDNYHTGFILDALRRVMDALGTDEWEQRYRIGADFYAARLFNADGSPRWMSDRDWPHDIHGAAQGILTFSDPRAGNPALAGRVLEWALGRMYDPEGRFHYQETRFGIKRFTFLRWCNAWMCRAVAAYLLNTHEEDRTRRAAGA